jgi:hypothetical protein
MGTLVEGPIKLFTSSSPEMMDPEPSAVKDPAAWYSPLLSNPEKKNAYWPLSFELLLATSVTVADAEEVLFAWAVAVRVTGAELDKLAGAV